MTMSTVRILQAAILMALVALAASCATSNQYVSKLFAPRPPLVRDSTRTVRFLELDSINNREEGWVSTDSIMKDKNPADTLPVIDDPVARTGKMEVPLPTPAGTRNKRSRE